MDCRISQGHKAPVIWSVASLFRVALKIESFEMFERHDVALIFTKETFCLSVPLPVQLLSHQ